MLTIVKFRVFDKDLEKVFYNNESLAAIHQALKEISHTYIAKEVIVAKLEAEAQAPTMLNALNVIKQQDEIELSNKK